MKKSRSCCRSRAGGGRGSRLGVPGAQPSVTRVRRAVPWPSTWPWTGNTPHGAGMPGARAGHPPVVRARGAARDREGPAPMPAARKTLCALEMPETATGRLWPSCRATSARACDHPGTPRPALARPSFLVDIARACPHEATAYCGAGQAHPAVCSVPTRSQRSPAARWSRIVPAPLLPPRRESKGRTGPPDWGQENCAARLCAVLPTAGGTTSARVRRSTSRITGSRASWCRSWTAPSWSRSASGAAQSWKTGWGPPTRVRHISACGEGRTWCPCA